MNTELQRQFDANPTFQNIQQQVLHYREQQAIRYPYEYSVAGSVAGGTTSVFNVLIEQGTDFFCESILGSAYSYDAVNPSSFPIPNAAGLAHWAGRGLAVQMIETGSGRNLTSGFIALENLLAPGYGISWQEVMPYKTLFVRNSKIQIDVRNRDNALRSHDFEIVFKGFKILTPQ